MTDSLRRRTRVHTGHTGVLHCQSRKYPMQAHNLSLKGLLCELTKTPDAHVPEPPAPECPCTVELPLASGLTVTVEGRVVRVDQSPSGAPLVAVDFTGMDPDSYAHLRNLVRYSAPDADAIDDEELHTPFTT